jgi:hypothetical protein
MLSASFDRLRRPKGRIVRHRRVQCLDALLTDWLQAHLITTSAWTAAAFGTREE